jgi:AbrB family looped-hinge helix DNA binding protein
MRTTIDKAGRVVIPKPLRDALGLVPGTELEILEQDGCVVIEPPPSRVRLVQREDGLVAEYDGDPPALTAADVRAVLEQVRP